MLLTKSISLSPTDVASVKCIYPRYASRVNSLELRMLNASLFVSLFYSVYYTRSYVFLTSVVGVTFMNSNELLTYL
jgi:hypothetical protein